MNIPTIAQIYAIIVADLEAGLNITISVFGKSFLRALAMVQAGKLWLLYLLNANIQKNIFVDTADPESAGGTLERFGRVYLNRDPFPATQAQYICTVTGVTGGIIPAGTQFISDDSALNPSVLFILDSAYTMPASTGSITLRALVSGSGSRLDIANTLTSIAPIPLVDRIATVTSQSVEPQEAEDIEAYRQKTMDAVRLEPQGGSGADYRIWAQEVSGIVRAYPYAATGLTSEVNIFLESDEPDGIPTLQNLQDVEDAIELPTADRPARKPLTVIVNYLPIVPRTIDINITSFTGITVDLQTLIYDAVQARLAEIRPFVDSIDIVADRDDYFDTNSVIQIVLEAQPGSVFGAVTMEVDSVPTQAITFTNGDIPTLNNITYV